MKRGWRLAGWAAGLLACGVALVLWWWPGGPESARVLPTAGVGTGGAAMPPPAAASAEQSAPITAPPAAPATAAAAKPLPDSVDLCGIGRVPYPRRVDGATRALTGALPGPLGAQARAAAWPRVLAALQSGTTPLEQAAALMLRIDGFVDAEAPEVPATGPEEDRPALTAQLVRMARAAQGPAQADIVRWALQACRRHKKAEGCSGLSPRDVLALDPSDGTAVLALAAAQPAERETLYRAAAAPGLRFRDWSDALPALVVAALPQDLPAYLAVDAAVLAIGIEAARQDSSGWEALMHCRPPALQEPTRRADCQALAEALTTRSASLASHGLGTNIAAKLGWPEPALQRLRDDEATAMRTAASRFDGVQPYACDSVQGLRAWVRERARQGDLRAALGAASAAAATSAQQVGR